MTTHEAIQILVCGDARLLATLSGVELGVLLHYIARADRHGVAFPSSESIARGLGHTGGNHVRAARARLVEKGVLIRLSRVGSRAPYQVAFMRGDEGAEIAGGSRPPASRSGTSPDSGRVPDRVIRLSEFGTGDRPGSGPTNVPKADDEPEPNPENEPFPEPGPGGSGGRPRCSLPRRCWSASMVSERRMVSAAPKGFERWWAVWPDTPRKVDRDDALAVWLAQDLEREADRIVAHTLTCSGSDQWTREGGRWMPAPVRYLQKRRFDAMPPGRAGRLTVGKDGASPRTPVAGAVALTASREIAMRKLHRDLALNALGSGELEALAREVISNLPPDIVPAFRGVDARRDEGLRWKMFEHLNQRSACSFETRADRPGFGRPALVHVS